jgi:hypothetical protein
VPTGGFATPARSPRSVCAWAERKYQYAPSENPGGHEEAVAGERVEGNSVGHGRAAVQTEHQGGHHAEGGGKEGENELVCERG